MHDRTAHFHRWNDWTSNTMMMETDFTMSFSVVCLDDDVLTNKRAFSPRFPVLCGWTWSQESRTGLAVDERRHYTGRRLSRRTATSKRESVREWAQWIIRVVSSASEQLIRCWMNGELRRVRVESGQKESRGQYAKWFIDGVWVSKRKCRAKTLTVIRRQWFWIIC